MSTSRIIMSSPLSPAPPGPRSGKNPARASRVVAQLVALPGRAFDCEVAQHRLSFASAPLAGHLSHADHSPLPAEAQWLDPALQKRSDHVDRIAQRFEHVVPLAPSRSLLHKGAVEKGSPGKLEDMASLLRPLTWGA